VTPESQSSGTPPRDYLEKHDTEAVDICLFRDRLSRYPLGRKIPHGSSDRGQRGVEVSPEKLHHAEVRNFRAEPCVHQYIFRLDVTVYDAALTPFVGISQALCGAKCDLVTEVPAVVLVN
jgi:hypothetical protein